jgi:hypothetical protein
MLYIPISIRHEDVYPYYESGERKYDCEAKEIPLLLNNFQRDFRKGFILHDTNISIFYDANISEQCFYAFYSHQHGT